MARTFDLGDDDDDPESAMTCVLRRAVLLMIVPTLVGAATPLPNPPLEGSLGKPTFDRVLVHSLTAARLQITLETSKLTELARGFPAAAIHHRGDAGNHQAWVCLAARTPAGLVTIRPSSGELEGGNIIDSVLLDRAGSRQGSDCPLVSQATLTPTFDGSLRLGMSEQSVTHRLGSPSSTEASILHYDYEVPTKGRAGQDCNVAGGLTISFDSDHRVTRIWAIRTTAC